MDHTFKSLARQARAMRRAYARNVADDAEEMTNKTKRRAERRLRFLERNARQLADWRAELASV